jgi:hypothetical protein
MIMGEEVPRSGGFFNQIWANYAIFHDFMVKINPLRMEVYFCDQNQNAKNIGNFTTLLEPYNIGTHLKGIETSFQVVPLFFKSFHFLASYITFWNLLKIPGL